MEKIHFLGVGGAGTSAAAALIKKSGFDKALRHVAKCVSYRS